MTALENRQPGDVRMRGFTRRTTLTDALDWLDAHTGPLASEAAPLEDACGRVLGEEIRSEVSVPGFARSMMDGYAVRAAETEGASAYNRLPLAVIGESMPGRRFDRPVAAGEAVRIMTGSPLPEGADAVLPAELVETGGDRILVLSSVSPGEHVGRVGEDITAGSVLFQPGRRLRPQDIGLLSSIGLAGVAVVRRPRVRIVVTGNELLPAGSRPEGCRIADSNGPMLRALVERDGGLAINPGIVPDRAEAILEAMRTEADLVLVSGGSSVGQEDYAPAMVIKHGTLPIHGIAMRPGSPTGIGLLDGRVVVLLPGNPVACLCAYDFFGGRAVRRLGGRPVDWHYRRVSLPLARKIVSTVGRDEYLRVRLADGGVEPLAIGSSSVLSSTSRADGFVVIPADSEGYPAGAVVSVYLYDP